MLTCGGVLAAVFLKNRKEPEPGPKIRRRRRVLEPTNRGGPRPLEILKVESDRVTLGVLPETGPSRRWRQECLWGLRWPEGYAQAGRILNLRSRQVTRRLRLLNGDLAPGTRVTLHTFAFPDDPGEAFGLPVQLFRYRSPQQRSPFLSTPEGGRGS